MFPPREASLQTRVFGPIDAAAAPPQPQPPTPLVPLVFDATNDMEAQQMAILCSVPLTDADDDSMNVDKDAGGQRRPSTPIPGRGISPSSAATAAAFAPPPNDPLAGTGPPAAPLDAQENEKLRFQNHQLTMQIEAMRAMIASTNAAADDKENKAKRYRHDAQQTMAASEAREQAILGEASQALNSVQA